MRRLLLATSALMSASFTLPAYAQSADTEARDGGEIVVTARKREENLIDVPLPISVATGEQLKRDQINNLNDLQRITPALEVSQTAGGESNGGSRLRGLGTGVFNPSVQPSVALVVDQAPIGNMSFNLLYDLAQVEVLRGPQGTLFGQGASAGVLNIATRAPSTDGIGVSGSVDFADKGTAGSEVGELLVNGAFNLPLGDDAAIRFASQYKRETGLQRSVTTGRDNVIKDFGVRIRALLEPADNFTVNLIGEYGKSESNGPSFFAIAIAPNSTTPFDPPGPPPPFGQIGQISTGAFLNPTGCRMTVISGRAEQFCEDKPSTISTSIGAISTVLQWEASDALTFTSVSAYRERSFKQFDRDFSRITGTFAARQENTQEDSRGFSQELRGNITGDSFDLVVGGYYTDYRFNRVPIGTGPFLFNNPVSGQRIGFSICDSAINACIPQSPPGAPPLFVNFSKETTENRSLAAFADATVKLGEQLSVFGGIRFDNYRNSTAIGTNTLNPTREFVNKDKNISGRIGVSFKPNPDTNIFSSFSRGYKPPAAGTNPAGSLFQLEAEKSDAFEVGAKTRLGRLQLTANAFYTRLENFQSQESIFVGTALISNPINVPRLKSKGFELTAFGEVLPGLNLNAGYQYNDIKYPAGFQGDDKINGVANSAPLGGTQFLFSPKHKFTLSGEYAAALGENLEAFLNANLIYKSKVLLAARADPRYRFEAHELVNLGLGIRHPDNNWTASVFVRNLTKSREPTAYLASVFAGQIDGGIRAWPVSGLTARVVGVRAGFEF